MPIRDHAHAPVGAGETASGGSGGLQKLQIHDFRNLVAVDIDPVPTVNLIHGANASGKTSLLEAIYVLSRGRSFRTRQFERVVHRGKDRYRVFARVSDQGRIIATAIERHRTGARIRIDGKDVQQLAPLAAVLPVQILHPNSHRLLEDGPQYRRRFLDWGVFHVEHSFLGQWQRYQKALKQRNAALRLNQPSESWESELTASGAALTALRRGYIEALVPLVQEMCGRLTEDLSLHLQFQQGWKEGTELAESLAAHRDSDRERGFTGVGPHRADLRIKVEGVTAADRLSRGQQKLLVSALIMAQTALFQSLTSRRAVLLVDDLPAELDRHHRQSLTAALELLGAQTFVTAIEPEQAPFAGPHRLFHVEHGNVHEMV